MEPSQPIMYFIHGKEVAEMLGLRYSKSLFETVVTEDNPSVVVGFCQGHNFETSDKVSVSQNLSRFTIHFKDKQLHEVIIFAETEKVALFLMDELFNLDNIARMTREVVSIEPVWESAEVS